MEKRRFAAAAADDDDGAASTSFFASPLTSRTRALPHSMATTLSRKEANTKSDAQYSSKENAAPCCFHIERHCLPFWYAVNAAAVNQAATTSRSV